MQTPERGLDYIPLSFPFLSPLFGLVIILPIMAATKESFAVTPEHASVVFFEEHEHGQEIRGTSEQLRRLRRKVDLLVMTFLTACYCLLYMDKVLLNVSIKARGWIAIGPQLIEKRSMPASRASSRSFTWSAMSFQALPLPFGLQPSLALWSVLSVPERANGARLTRFQPGRSRRFPLASGSAAG